MKLITAIVRPEKVMDVIKALEQEGYFAFSKWADTADDHGKPNTYGRSFMLRMNLFKS